jgi:hypothetical protein
LNRSITAGEFFESFFLRSIAFADVESLFHSFDRVFIEGRHDLGRKLTGLGGDEDD